MISYLLRRLAGTVPVLVLISLLVFLLIHAAPGDPTLMLLGEETNAAEVAKAKARWGLDQPLYVQYWKFLKSVAAGDFGKSFKYAEPVTSVIRSRLPATNSRSQINSAICSSFEGSTAGCSSAAIAMQPSSSSTAASPGELAM